MGQAQLARRLRVEPVPGREAGVAQAQLAGAWWQQAREHVEQLALPVARHAGHAHDLAGAQAQVDAVQADHAQRVGDPQAARFEQHRCARRRAWLNPANVDLASDHGLGQAFDAGFGDRQFLHHAPGAHHRDLIAQAHHLLELVGDQQNGGALLAQAIEHAKQMLGLLRRQDRGRLVQDQNPGAPVQRLENLQALAVADRQRGHALVQIDQQTGAAHQRVELDANRRLGALQQPVRLGTEHDVVQRAQRVDQHEVLVHHANAQRDRIVGLADAGGLAKDLDLSAVGAVKAVQDRHQRALAGAVLTDDAVHRRRPHVQRNIGVGLDRAKALVDAPHAHRRGGIGHQYLQALSAM